MAPEDSKLQKMVFIIRVPHLDRTAILADSFTFSGERAQAHGLFSALTVMASSVSKRLAQPSPLLLLNLGSILFQKRTKKLGQSLMGN